MVGGPVGGALGNVGGRIVSNIIHQAGPPSGTEMLVDAVTGMAGPAASKAIKAGGRALAGTSRSAIREAQRVAGQKAEAVRDVYKSVAEFRKAFDASLLKQARAAEERQHRRADRAWRPPRRFRQHSARQPRRRSRLADRRPRHYQGAPLRCRTPSRQPQVRRVGRQQRPDPHHPAASRHLTRRPHGREVGRRRRP